jgi:hypothetical protein
MPGPDTGVKPKRPRGHVTPCVHLDCVHARGDLAKSGRPSAVLFIAWGPAGGATCRGVELVDYTLDLLAEAWDLQRCSPSSTTRPPPGIHGLAAPGNDHHSDLDDATGSADDPGRASWTPPTLISTVVLPASIPVIASPRSTSRPTSVNHEMILCHARLEIGHLLSLTRSADPATAISSALVSNSGPVSVASMAGWAKGWRRLRRRSEDTRRGARPRSTNGWARATICARTAPDAARRPQSALLSPSAVGIDPNRAPDSCSGESTCAEAPRHERQVWAS